MSLATFLNGREPAQLRGLMWLSLSEAGDLLTQVSTSDSGGGVTRTWGTAGTAVPCRVDPLTANSRETGGQIDERSTHYVTVPTGTNVSTNDRFAISGRGTFEVTAVREQTAGSAEFFEVIQIS
jgi:hypothetical protein